MKKKIIIIAAAAVLILIVFFVGSYNGLAAGREEVVTARANIDTMLQRRADLIPNLVDTVKSFAAHETEVYDRVLAARENLLGADSEAEKARADEELSQALDRIQVVVENYPELKSDSAYVSLMDELEGSENRIAVSRKDYNDAVLEYNNQVICFPGNLMAGLFGYKKADYFEASADASEIPDVGGALDE